MRAGAGARVILLAFLIGLPTALSGGRQAEARTGYQAGAGYQDMAAAGIESLQHWYDWSRGLWATTN